MIPHGTSSKYVNDNCRCVECLASWATYNRNRKAARRAYVEANGLPAEVEHGESAYTNWGCRCTICTAAASAAGLRRYHAARKANAR